MRVALPDGCLGMDAPDGRTYRPERGRASVDIPDPVIARQARRQYGTGYDIAFRFNTHDAKAAQSVACSSCGFERWEWVQTCPRCDGNDNHAKE